ncbi:uroporphyrinogen-III synthase [Vibrio galatheae]|uniref:Uroporphyrinogen-III synthase n=1 Tax=Vibrio galatheae TaxID=579748 RepID=A0A0F4NFA7_9VIBR|nr:uroporphyrinogen-III synthase [Vibrio galatheae]KJY81619.1 uroporphyrinogen-III synthase [Vibrio galatheae]
MPVLVTRPGQQGHELCQQLSKVGINSYHQPLIEIQPSEQLLGLELILAQFDIIIAVSQHAASVTDTYLTQSGQNWPTNATYLAVGQKTAHVLSNATQQKVHYPQVSDSEHLLQLASLQSIANRKVLILRGNGGRELIFNTLVERGALVTYREVYKRQNLAFRSDLLVPLWQNEQIDQLVITSSGQLSYFMSQLTDDHKNWLFTLHLYVPSERIAQQAREIGFQAVTNTFSASNKVLLAALRPSETGP